MTAAERREQLIEIARGLFAERGVDGASVEEIAARAGVSKPIVYEHFGGKEGLYAVVVDREVRQLLAMMRAALDADHPRILIEQSAFALLDYVEQHSDGFRILVRDSPIGSASGSYVSIISDIASRVEGIPSTSSAGVASTRRLHRCTHRCWSGWSAPPVSGGWTPASRPRRPSRRTWSTSPGTALPVSRRSPRCAATAPGEVGQPSPRWVTASTLLPSGSRTNAPK
jgi:AcrR family transcriptional regulator